jgi:hypothetical protein
MINSMNQGSVGKTLMDFCEETESPVAIGLVNNNVQVRITEINQEYLQMMVAVMRYSAKNSKEGSPLKTIQF